MLVQYLGSQPFGLSVTYNHVIESAHAFLATFAALYLQQSVMKLTEIHIISL